MDLSNAKKVNDLALDFVKKGFASSSQEAFEMAKSVIEKDSKKGDNTISENVIEKVEIELERRNRAFFNEMRKIKDQLKELESQLTLLKQDTSKLKVSKSNGVSVIKEENKKDFSKYSEYSPEDVAVDKIFYSGKNGNR